MITFRHFLTSLVAVFLALAVGIVLGGGPLSDVTDPDPAPAAATEDAPPTRPGCTPKASPAPSARCSPAPSWPSAASPS